MCVWDWWGLKFEFDFLCKYNLLMVRSNTTHIRRSDTDMGTGRSAQNESQLPSSRASEYGGRRGLWSIFNVCSLRQRPISLGKLLTLYLNL